MISGANIAGGNGMLGRVQDDYYATPPEATKKLLEAHWFRGRKVLEPCAGAGHIAKVVKERYPECEMTCIDIVDRGYPGTLQADYLSWAGDCGFDTIITNPPYVLANEFIEHSMGLLTEGGSLPCP